MEAFIPLVKAIIISTMFSWGTSSVVITDQYMLKEDVYKNQDSENEVTEYQIYDLRRNVIHVVDQQMQFRVSSHIDTLHKYEIHTRGSRDNNIRILNTSIENQEFGGYKCKMETKEMEERYFLDGPQIKKYAGHSYFAKIPWLDKILDTQDKREFARFERQEYSPYHYLIYEFLQYPNQAPKDKVLRIIEKSEVDTTLIHNLLSLPVKKN
jgi:hypothetical protein